MKKKNTLRLLILCLILFSHKLINAQCNIDDWTALKALYEAADGDNWRNNTGWEAVKNEAPPLDCNLENLHGVSLNNIGRVDSLIVNSNIIASNFTRTLPAEIGNLSSLILLDLSRIFLKGVIPSEIGNLSSLKSLDLSSNSFTGDIPSEIGNLSSLKSLDLSWNSLTGGIPSEIGNLESLTSLDLSTNNHLGGSIPSEIGNLASLNSLDLGGNSLTGGIPSEIGNLKSLTSLNFYFNRLSGSLPKELGNLESLNYLDLSSNDFSGDIPSELGNLSNLKELHLLDNKLSGSIPNEIGGLSSLTDMLLQRNEFTGSLPITLGNLKNLEILRLIDNKISGNIPPEMGNLPSLKHLQLNSNELNGSIPAELGNLSSLEYLNLSNNQLSGSIPPEIGNLISSSLNLSNNQLSGSIPPEIENLVSYSLNLSNNQLSGSIPPEIGNLISSSLNLSNNQLSGSIPPEIGNLVSSNLNLSNNQLSGNIPPEILNSELYGLNLSSNQLSGSIPPEIGNLVLNNLNLSSNQFVGNIPPEIGNSIKLKKIDLSNNQLTGNIPNEISNLHSLDCLILNNNQLSGSIPDLGGSQGIRGLDLSHNLYICSEIENINFIDWEIDYGCMEDDCDDIDPLPPRPDPFYNHTPQIYQHNAEQSFLIDVPSTSITLSAPFNQTGNFTYQWHINDTVIDGATDSTLFLNNVYFKDVGNYTLHIKEPGCRADVSEEGITYISKPIAVQRTDLEGCTEINACNYNQHAMIDDGSCEYFSCETLINPIKIRTTNEVVLSDTQIKFDIIIDSLGLDYSADGLTFKLDTRGNYNIESIEVLHTNLLMQEVDLDMLDDDIISINRISSQRLGSNEPVLSATACIINENIPTETQSCSQFIISGGTRLANGNFIYFENIYIDIPFSSCSFNEGDDDGYPRLPLVLTISPQNCNTNTLGLVEIKILEEGQSPFSYILINQNDEIVLQESGNNNNVIELQSLQAGNYMLNVSDSNEKQITMQTYIPLIANVNEDETCNTACVDYAIISGLQINGNNYSAKKEIEIKGFVDQTQTVEFGICK